LIPSSKASPQTPLGSLQRSPDPLAVGLFKVPTSKGIEGRERGKEGNERKGSGRKGMGKAVRVETGRRGERGLYYTEGKRWAGKG